MTVLYFGVYNADYSRNRVLIKGLKENGVNIIECRLSPGLGFLYLRLFLKYLAMRPRYDLMLVGFPGQEIMFLAKLLTRKPIIFDAFTSHYGGYILDRKYFSETSWRAKYYRFLDKWSCWLADMVLLDTNAHINFFIKEFGLPKEKFRRIFVGADSNVFYPRKREGNDFVVHFHGNYIPLQGVRYIIKAAKILEKDGVHFRLIGRGQTYEDSLKLAQELDIKNLDFRDKISYDSLAVYITQADIVLGIFGDSQKTGLVIPNKVFEGLASGIAVITADTEASRELLENGKTALLCPNADPEALAQKILELKKDPERRSRIAKAGYDLFKSRLTPKILGGELINFINERNTLSR